MLFILQSFLNFYLKKASYPIIVFVGSLFSTKKSLKVVSFLLVDEKLCLNLWRYKQAYAFKNYEKCFLFSFSTYLDFCFYFSLMQKKRLDQKDKVNFKIYKVTTLLANNYNTHIAQHFTKQRQSENEISSVNRIQHLIEYIMYKMREGDQFQTSFCFLKKLYAR